MKDIFKRMNNTIEHLKILHKIFAKEDNFRRAEKIDYDIYKQNEKKLTQILNKLNFNDQIYTKEGRQMILADFLEYIFLGRGYYSMQSIKDREDFVRGILHFVNLLMCYEVMTVSDNLRKKILEELAKNNPEIRKEEYYSELKDFIGRVGLKKGESNAPKYLNRYFDSLLPKTAGGLWHELLVYIFLLRNDIGYIVPLLLSQRLVSREGSIIPPDFLIITSEKNIYGIEVGRKKEIQSGSFSLQTNIPTATIDTENSRVSDRCPICKRWIPFCDFVINNYSKFNTKITKAEVRCLKKCNAYSQDAIALGKCPYTKYSRRKKRTLKYTQHQYANGLHYHYRCVLKKVSKRVRNKVVKAKDIIALKTHFPYYSGLEELMKKKG